MNKILTGMGAAFGLAALGCVHALDGEVTYAQTGSSQLENGLTRETRVLCHRDGSVELQLNYLNAAGKTDLFVSLDRRNGLYCTEAISVVDPIPLVPVITIMYDDRCNSTMDRFSKRPAGSRVENAMHYRSLWDNETAEANDAVYASMRSRVDGALGIEAQMQACEERNQE